MILKTQSTGSGAISYTLNPSDTGAFQIERIELHLSATGGATENLTVTKDDSTGAAYDVVYLTQAMAAVSDVIWQPTRPYELVSGDKLVIAYPNTNSRTYGLTIYYRPH